VGVLCFRVSRILLKGVAVNHTALVSAGSLCRSAWSVGSLRAFCFRSSSRSFSGSVLVASFACPRRAGRFAARWARRLRVSVFVRRGPGGLWAVSVPALGLPPAAVSGSVAGLSVRGFRAALVASGVA